MFFGKFRCLSYRHLLDYCMAVVHVVVRVFMLKCFGIKIGALRFFIRPCPETVLEKCVDFCDSTCVQPGH